MIYNRESDGMFYKPGTVTVEYELVGYSHKYSM